MRERPRVTTAERPAWRFTLLRTFTVIVSRDCVDYTASLRYVTFRLVEG